MTFYEVLAEVRELLQRQGRVSYRALKRQFNLDDEYLEDLKAERIDAQRLAVDEDGKVLVWRGGTATTSTPVHASPPAPRSYTPPYLAEKILTSKSTLEGERKQVTVLFADLKGSMELLADRDPEEARQLLDPVLERMMAAVHRYEGTVNQVMGDGIMALFGAPIAHEDHAVRACYAALAMQEAVKHYAAEVQRTHGVALQICVGMNAGEVVVRAIGNDLHMEYSAIGQTTHLAARMEQMAMPGSSLITQAVLGLAEGYVSVRPLGPVPVKGLTRFVGRDTELVALGQALERAAAGHGQVVAVVGEAGVGKSRLVYKCIHAHHTQGWRVLETASVSYGKATPYFPVIDLLKRYTHVEESDDPRTVRAKVTGQILTLDETLQDTLPALLSLMDALPADSPFGQIDLPQRRQRTLDALKRVLLRESQEQRLLLVCEDLHWIDSETQTLLDSLVESLPTARILLLVNYRLEYQHGWGSKTFYTQVRLDPLAPARADELLQALMGTDTSLAALIPLLIARTEGNPFFLEESVQTLVEMQVLVGARGGYRLAQPLASLQVPATVQAVLAARIDRLPLEEKRLLRTAAVIGTEVPLPLLQAIAELPEAALHRGLAHLQAAEFLYETRLFPEREYTFKHALTHEVAYSSLLQEQRRALHAHIVEALEALAGDRVAEQVEWLAHHAFRGELWDKALAYCRQAGEKALVRSAHREASGRRPGGQPGHEGHTRALVPVEAVDVVIPLTPVRCAHCQHLLLGEDPQPERHQVTELPAVRPVITEYQLHGVVCPGCGEATRAVWPVGIPTGGFGPRVQAITALCTGAYHLSTRPTQTVLADLCGVSIGLGTVANREQATVQALAEPVAEARASVPAQPAAYLDETGWREGRQRAWLWTAVTAWGTVFSVRRSRSATVARELLGEGLWGWLVTDRWSAYTWYPTWRRQVCWAHLRRDMEAMLERGGRSQEMGEAVRAQVRLVVQWWQRVREGTLAHTRFASSMRPIRQEVERLLEAGQTCGVAKTEGVGRESLKMRQALGTFVRHEGVEPTNNAAERAIRPGVLWRKGSFGTQSPEGSRFVETMMTVVATLQQQHRNVLD